MHTMKATQPDQPPNALDNTPSLHTPELIMAPEHWNVTTIRAHFDARLADLEKRYEQRFMAQDQAVKDALAAAEKAVNKAEVASEKRFEGVNEFRATLADQQRTLMPRQESEAMHSSTRHRVESVESIVERLQAERAGLKGGWAIAIAVVGVVALITSIILRFNP